MYVSIRDDVLLWAWPTIEEGLRDLGLDAVELNLDRECTVHLLSPVGGEARADISNPAQAEAYRAQLEAKGVRAAALMMSTNFSNPDVDQEIQWVIDAVRAAERIDVEALRIDAIMHKEKEWPLEKRISVFADCMKKVLDATPNSKVEMGIENHGIQGNTPEFLDSVLGSVGSDRLGITMDTGNFYWAGHPISKVYEILEHFASRTKHTHCKNIRFPEEMRDIKREPGWEYDKRACLIRDGDIDHQRVAALLKKAGYKRDLCIEDESFYWMKDEHRKRPGMIDDARYMKEILVSVECGVRSAE